MNPELHFLDTPDGVRFGSLGQPWKVKASTILVIGSDLEYSLTTTEINEIGQLLGPKGVASFALDVPCHGIDSRPNEPQGMEGWRARLESDEDFVAPFNQKISSIIDHLIAEGYSDPDRIAMVGTSRGGFMGLHAMAAEPRIRWGIAFAPVTELPILGEFHGLENHPLTKSLALLNVADQLVGRPLWMCIGSTDERVGTDALIAFSRKIVAASVAKDLSPPVELHILQTEGHRIHATAHEEAAHWLSNHWNDLSHPSESSPGND